MALHASNARATPGTVRARGYACVWLIGPGITAAPAHPLGLSTRTSPAITIDMKNFTAGSQSFVAPVGCERLGQCPR
jgi:hypothetical protein